MSKITIKDENYASGSPYFHGSNVRDENGDKIFQRGNYFFDNGIVSTYQQGYLKGDEPWLSMTLCWFGRTYHRTIRGKLYTDIGIARKAGQFAREITSRPF